MTPRTLQELTPAQGVAAVVAAIDDLKGRDVRVLDMRGISDATDYFVIASGTSDAHVRGIAKSVVEQLHRRGSRANQVEGLQGGRWVLIDFVDYVVHLFHPETRGFYQLERLWGDAPEITPGA